MAAWVLLALCTGSAVFCVLALLAVRSFKKQPQGTPPGAVSILKPLRGVDLGLEENLSSFFALEGQFELVFAIQDATDPAYALCERLIAEHPRVDARIVLTGAPEWHNAKVWQMAQAWDSLKHPQIVTSDSDIRVPKAFLKGLGSEFDVATCPYKAVGGPSIWSALEAVGMNTEFLAGLMVARMLEGVKFAVGPTMYVKRGVIEKIGGWQQLSEFLAEDFVIGQRAAEKGMKVGISRQVVEHRIGSDSLVTNFKHRLRWYRSTRRSRPAGYLGQLFTMPVPLAFALVLVKPEWGWLFFALLVLRLWVARSAMKLVGASASFSFLIVQDILSFAFWIAGLFGRKIEWRGRHYRLGDDGRFVRLSD